MRVVLDVNVRAGGGARAMTRVGCRRIDTCNAAMMRGLADIPADIIDAALQVAATGLLQVPLCFTS